MYASESSPVYTCDYYNISSSSTEILPVVDYGGYSIDPPQKVWDSSISQAKQRLSVTVPTDVLRNSSSGNQIEFYIFGVYNNYPTDAEADGRYAVYSSKMVIDVQCGGESIYVDSTSYHL